MDIEKVEEFNTGKNDWNTMEIGLKDGNIVVRDEVGMIEFEEDAIDQLVNGIDQARRRLREKQRRPTQSADEQDTTDTATADDEADTDTDESDEQDDTGMPGTGLGPTMR